MFGVLFGWELRCRRNDCCRCCDNNDVEKIGFQYVRGGSGPLPQWEIKKSSEGKMRYAERGPSRGCVQALCTPMPFSM